MILADFAFTLTLAGLANVAISCTMTVPARPECVTISPRSRICSSASRTVDLDTCRRSASALSAGRWSPGFSSSTYASKCMSCTARIIAGFNPFADPIATSSLPDEASISSQCKVGMLCVPWRIWLRDMRVRVLRRHVRSSESLQLARCCARISCRRRSWRWTDG